LKKFKILSINKYKSISNKLTGTIFKSIFDVFLLVALTVFIVQCAKTPFENENGFSGASIDTLEFNSNVIDSVKNASVVVSSNNAIYNMVGNYKNIQNKFSLEFLSLNSLESISDTEKVIIKNADIKFYQHKDWNNIDNAVNLDVRRIAPDSIYWWNNSSVPDSIWSSIYNNSTEMISNYSLDLSGDSTLMDIDVNIIKDWIANPDSNNGMIFELSESNADEMISFYSYDYSDVSLIPQLILECEISDTNDVYLFDSTFTIYSTCDLQYSESDFEVGDDSLVASQGAIYRPLITLDSLRKIDSIDERMIINSAVVTLTIDQLKSSIGNEDTLSLYVGYFQSNSWDGEDIQYDFATGKTIENITALTDTISISIPYVIQKIIATTDYQQNGIFIQVDNERYDFNRIYFNKNTFNLNLVYTNFIRENE
jgi:hypothetical protein